MIRSLVTFIFFTTAVCGSQDNTLRVQQKIQQGVNSCYPRSESFLADGETCVKIDFDAQRELMKVCLTGTSAAYMWARYARSSIELTCPCSHKKANFMYKENLQNAPYVHMWLKN